MATTRDNVIRSAGLIALLTLVSRLLGIVRDMVCAAVFGAGVAWDAFSFAFRVPNLFRRLFGEGALSAAFMPLFAEKLESPDDQQARRFAGRVAGVLVLVLIAVVVVGEAVLLVLRQCSSPGPRWQLALQLTAILLPYALFICMTALAGAVLNALGHFAAPAAAPVLLNAVWIAALLAVAGRAVSDPMRHVYVLAAAVLLAGVLQLSLQLAVLRRRGFACALSFSPRHPEVRRVARAMAPVALGLAAFQLNALLDGVIAISLAAPPGRTTFGLMGATLPYPMQVGANSVLYYANRLTQFPLGVFGVALGTAIFPALSRQAAAGQRRQFAASVVDGLGLALFIALPAGVGLMLLGRPAVELLFERGRFAPPMTARTAACVLAYSSALWAYCAQHVLVRAFYSLKLYATPARVAGAMVAVNLALNLVLVWPLGEAGLAAATAVSASMQTVVLARLLHGRIALPRLDRLAVEIGRTGIATAGMAAICWGVLQSLPQSAGLSVRVARVLLPAVAGVVTYIGLAAVLCSRELRHVMDQLRRSGGATPPNP